MIQLRMSKMGACLYGITKSILKPEDIEPEKRLFLFLGHSIQDGFLSLLEKELRERDSPLRLEEVEATKVVYIGPTKWNTNKEDLGEEPLVKLVGHIDGRLRHPKGIIQLEIKAITDKYAIKLNKATHWTKIYSNYRPQNQCYIHADPEAIGSIFIFINRATSEVMGGLQNIPWINYRKDMVEKPNKDLFEKLVDKARRAAQYIERKEIADECGIKGFCFDCKKWRGQPAISTSLVGHLDKGEYPQIDNLLKAWKKAGEIRQLLINECENFGVAGLASDDNSFHIGQIPPDPDKRKKKWR